MELKYILIILIYIVLLVIILVGKERFVMDINGNIPANLFIETRIPSNNIPTIEIILPNNRIYNPIAN